MAVATALIMPNTPLYCPIPEPLSPPTGVELQA